MPEALKALGKQIAEGVKGSVAQTMLTPGIHDAYEQGLDRLFSSSQGHSRQGRKVT